ncbi:MAG: hypothetical protein H7232_05575 [Aeromicrobium sp.]|nr:hypothetical protein [Burkholderiales bacterium]
MRRDQPILMRRFPIGYATVVLCLAWFSSTLTAVEAPNIIGDVSASNANTQIPNDATQAAALALTTRYAAMRSQLANNAFNRPLVLESAQSANSLKGEVYAVVPYAFAKLSDDLTSPQGWCAILNLHLNTKYCRADSANTSTQLVVNLGEKNNQPLLATFRITFQWQVTAKNPQYMRVLLTAASGPLGTHDYRIALDGVPLESGDTFLRLSYSYDYSFASKIAAQAYLATAGRAKIGFTITALKDGVPTYVDGMRGLIERNTMRYHLAVESFLGAQAVAAPLRFEKRINDWIIAVERYPRQLHEIEKPQYLEMKRRENRRQMQDDLGG